ALTVHFLNERCSAPLAFVIPKVYWRARPKDQIPGQGIPRPTFTVTDVVDRPRPDGAIKRSAKIKIGKGRFAGMAPFDATFEFILMDQDCTIALTTTGWPEPTKTARFAAVDFVDFMGGGLPRAPLQHQARLQVAMSATESKRLVAQLFGDRLRRSSQWRRDGSLAPAPDTSSTLAVPSANP